MPLGAGEAIQQERIYPQRASESGTGGTNAPKGAAGGALKGEYPNPTLAAGSVTTEALATNQPIPGAPAEGSLAQQSFQSTVRKIVARINGNGAKKSWEFTPGTPLPEQTVYSVLKVVNFETVLSGWIAKFALGNINFEFTVAPAAKEELLLVAEW